MIVTKRHKHRAQSPTESPSPSNKLFIDYPYPIITELNEIYTQSKQANHPHDLASLRWYTDCFHKVFNVLHGLHSHDSILEQSFRQANINGRSSKTLVNSLQKKTQPTRVRKVLASSINNQDEQKDQRHVKKITIVSFDD
jgi:hypothetical protein